MREATRTLVVPACPVRLGRGPLSQCLPGRALIRWCRAPPRLENLVRMEGHAVVEIVHGKRPHLIVAETVDRRDPRNG